MESALAWIGQIASWIGQWIPRWSHLDTTEGAILYRGYLWPLSWRKWGWRPFLGEMKVTTVGQGIHFWWPARTTLCSYPTARQTDRLESQTLETADGKTFIVAGTITYCVTDLTLLLPVVHMATRNTVDLAMTALHDVCCEMSWEGLQNEQRKGTLKTKLKNAAQRQLEEYGIKVIKFQLNSLARCRVLKVSQSTSSEEN